MNREDAKDPRAFSEFVDTGQSPAAQAASADIPHSAFRIPHFLAGPYPTLVSRLLLGGIFFLSGLTKLGVPQTFSESIRSYGMPLPPEVVQAMAVWLPPLELGLGIWLLVGLFTRFAAAVSGGLVLIFLIAMFQAMLRGLDPNCGCFAGAEGNALRALGPVGEWLTDEKVGIGSITRDLAFLLMSLHLIFVPTIFALDNWRKARREEYIDESEEPGEEE
jgi:putative oxidoreductase